MTQTDIRPTATTADTAATDAAPDQGCACPGGCGSRGRSVTRRTAIGAGVIAGAALVTACGSSDTATSSSATTTPSSTGSSTSSTASSSSASSAPTSSSTSESSESTESTSSASSSSAAPAGTEIAKLADVPSGGSLIVANGNDQIALARNADGTVVAHTAICTHQGCTVKADGAALMCPCHGSTFDAFTGAVTKPPAQAALAAITVEVSGDAVYLTA